MQQSAILWRRRCTSLHDHQESRASGGAAEATVAGPATIEIRQRRRTHPRPPRKRELHRDRRTAATAAVGIGNHAGIAPYFRIHRVVGREDAHDRPGLVAKADLMARHHACELLHRALAHDELAHARLESTAVDDLHLRAHSPGLFAHTAQLDAAFLVGLATLDGEVRRHDELGRGDGLSFRILRDALGLRNQHDAVAIEHGHHFRS